MYDISVLISRLFILANFSYLDNFRYDCKIIFFTILFQL